MRAGEKGRRRLLPLGVFFGLGFLGWEVGR